MNADVAKRIDAHEPTTLGEHIADRAAAAIGSWRFICVQTVLVGIWVTVNAVGIILRWDPYPFVLLNLMFSVQAAYTGPILLLAGNRQAQRDRAMAAKDDQQLDRLERLQDEQMALLRQSNEHVAATRAWMEAH